MMDQFQSSVLWNYNIDKILKLPEVFNLQNGKIVYWVSFSRLFPVSKVQLSLHYGIKGQIAVGPI